MDKKIYIKDILREEETLSNLTQEAAKDSWNNFHDFHKRKPDYLHYHVAEYGYSNIPIAMAGMFKSKFWPSNFVRILDRCYYFKVARSSTLSFLNEKQLKATASNYFLPLQIEIALENNLVPFFSIAGIKRRAAMKRMIDKWNSKNYKKLILLPNMYFTCNHSVDDNTNEMCWQNIAILNVSGCNDFNLPSRKL